MVKSSKLFLIHTSHKNFCRYLQRSFKQGATSEKVFSRARTRTRSIIEFVKQTRDKNAAISSNAQKSQVSPIKEKRFGVFRLRTLAAAIFQTALFIVPPYLIIGADSIKIGTKGKSFCSYCSAATPGKVLKNVHGRTFLSLADKRKWRIKPATDEVPNSRHFGSFIKKTAPSRSILRLESGQSVFNL